MSKGRFITVEGIDGAGKTMLTKRLAERLERSRHPVTCTREPTDDAIGSIIRNALGGRLWVAPEAMGLLFAADRWDHTRRVILPALDQGKVVLCDRYDYSNLVYRAAETPGPLFRCARPRCGWEGEPGDATGIWPEMSCPRCLDDATLADAVVDRLEWTRSLTDGVPEPDLILVLSLRAEEAAARLRERGSKPELYENTRMLERCALLYADAHETLRRPSENVMVIDAARPPLVVLEAALNAVRVLLEEDDEG